MSLTGSFVIVAVDGAPVHGPHSFDLELSEGRVHGRVVNRFSGTAEVGDDNIVVGPIAATRMAGPPEIMAVEDAVFRVLTGMLTVSAADDGTTVLTGEHGSLTLAAPTDGIEYASSAI